VAPGLPSVTVLQLYPAFREERIASGRIIGQSGKERVVAELKELRQRPGLAPEYAEVVLDENIPGIGCIPEYEAVLPRES